MKDLSKVIGDLEMCLGQLKAMSIPMDSGDMSDEPEDKQSESMDEGGKGMMAKDSGDKEMKKKMVMASMKKKGY